MLRRAPLLLLTVLAVASLPGGCSSPAPAGAERPNVLFLAVDDLRPELGCYGARHAVTPHIDRLAASGVTFTQAHCQQAVCNPSRASVMTGLRPETLGVLDLRTDFRDAARPDAVTLAEQLGRHGYRTWAIGKIFHNTLPDPRSWTEPKTHLDGYPFDPDAVYRAADNVAALAARKEAIREAGRAERHLDRFGEWYIKHTASESPDVADDAYYDGAQTTAAIERLAELAAGDAPFFAAVGFYRPHLPFNAPRRYWDLYDPERIPLPRNADGTADAPPMAINNMRELRGYRDFRDAPLPYDGPLDEAQVRHLRHGYLASVSYIDAQVGRLLDALDELGLTDDTIVVLWSDHGWKLGEHRSWGKMTNYELDTRVPLIVRAPGVTPAGGRAGGLVELLDLYPTLTGLCGVPAPAGLEGRSLLPQLHDPQAPGKDAVFTVFLREGIWRGPDGKTWIGHAIRTRTHRYVEWREHPGGAVAARELYDHRVDPDEAWNLAGRDGQAPLMRRLAERLRDAGAGR